MAGINLQNTPFEGRTAAVPWRRPYDPLECRGCGSSLVGRRIGVERQTTQGVSVVVETFKCGCLKQRRIRREVAATR